MGFEQKRQETLAQTKTRAWERGFLQPGSCTSQTTLYNNSARECNLERIIKPITLNLSKFKAEYKRLHSMTTFARAMDKAIDIKADRWLSYKPLSREQLFDTVDHRDFMTIIVPFGGRLSHARSTYRGASWYGQKTVLSRPTHTLGILHALGMFVLDSDFIVIRQEPNRQTRYCVICKAHHEVTDFIRNKRYLNELSFACKRSLEDGKRGIWRKVA